MPPYNKRNVFTTTSPNRSYTKAEADNKFGGGATVPLTTKGDLYTFTTVGARLPVGNNAEVLVADSSTATGLKWSAAASGSGITRTISSVSSPTTAAAVALTDYVYLVSGTTTLTLPTAVGNSNRYTVKNTGSNTVTVATTSAQTIDGSSTASLPVPNTSLDLISDGSNWNVI